MYGNTYVKDLKRDWSSFYSEISSCPQFKVDFVALLASDKDLKTNYKGLSRWFVVFRNCPFSGLINLISTGRINGYMIYTPRNEDILGGYFSTDRVRGFTLTKQNIKNKNYGLENNFEAELNMLDNLKQFWPNSFDNSSPYKETQLFRRASEIKNTSKLGWLDLDLPKSIARTNLDRPFKDNLKLKYPSTDNMYSFLYVAYRMGIQNTLVIYKSTSTMLGKSKNSVHILFPFSAAITLETFVKGVDIRSRWLDISAKMPHISTKAYKLLKELGYAKNRFNPNPPPLTDLVCLPQSVIGLTSSGIPSSPQRSLPDKGIYRTTQPTVCNFTGQDPVLWYMDEKSQKADKWYSEARKIEERSPTPIETFVLYTEKDQQQILTERGTTKEDLRKEIKRRELLRLTNEVPASTKVYRGTEYLGTVGELDKLPYKTNCNSISRPDKPEIGAAYIPGNNAGIVIEFSEDMVYTIVHNRQDERQLFSERIATSNISNQSSTSQKPDRDFIFTETEVGESKHEKSEHKSSDTNSSDTNSSDNSKTNSSDFEEREQVIEYDTKYAPFPSSLEHENTLILSVTGSGKSYSSVRLTPNMRGDKVFVVEPYHSAADNIFEEFRQHTDDVIRFQSGVHKTVDLLKSPRIVVLTFDMFYGIIRRLNDLAPEMTYSIIIDEVHELFTNREHKARKFLYSAILKRQDYMSRDLYGVSIFSVRNLRDILCMSATLDIKYFPTSTNWDIYRFVPKNKRPVTITNIFPWKKMITDWSEILENSQEVIADKIEDKIIDKNDEIEDKIIDKNNKPYNSGDLQKTEENNLSGIKRAENKLKTNTNSDTQNRVKRLAFVSVPSRVMATEMYEMFRKFKNCKVLRVVGGLSDRNRVVDNKGKYITNNNLDSNNKDQVKTKNKRGLHTTHTNTTKSGESVNKHGFCDDNNDISTNVNTRNVEYADFKILEDLTIEEIQGYDVVIATGTISVGTSFTIPFKNSITVYRGRGIRGGIASWIQRLSRTRQVEDSFVVVGGIPIKPKYRIPYISYNMVYSYGLGDLKTVEDYQSLYKLAHEHMLSYSIEINKLTQDEIFVHRIHGTHYDELRFSEFGARLFIASNDNKRQSQVWIKTNNDEIALNQPLMERLLSEWSNWDTTFEIEPLTNSQITEIEDTHLKGISSLEELKDLKKHYREQVKQFKTIKEVEDFLNNRDECVAHRDRKDEIRKHLPFKDKVVTGLTKNGSLIYQNLTEEYQVKSVTSDEVRNYLTLQEYIITLQPKLYQRLLKIKGKINLAGLTRIFQLLFGRASLELISAKTSTEPLLRYWPDNFNKLNKQDKKKIIFVFIYYLSQMGRIIYYNKKEVLERRNDNLTHIKFFAFQKYDNIYQQFQTPNMG